MFAGLTIEFNQDFYEFILSFNSEITTKTDH